MRLRPRVIAIVSALLAGAATAQAQFQQTMIYRGSEAEWIGAIARGDSRLPGGNDFHTPGLKKPLAAQWNKVAPLAKQSILLRKEFTVDGPVESATIDISGLGHYHLYINGKRVGEDYFQPLWSEYDKTVYFNTFYIKDYLVEGRNTIGVVLGNGMYNVAGGRYTKFRHSYGPPVLILEAKVGGGKKQAVRIVTDASWKWSEGPASFNCIFGGEDYDATLEQPGWDKPGFDDSSWKTVVTGQGPKGKLTAQTAPPVRIMERFPVHSFKQIEPGKYLFDMGQNLSGFPTIRVEGKKGQKIRLLPAEQLDKTGGDIAQGSSGAPYWWEYTLKGEGLEEWTPMFSYYGYQYLRLEGADYLEADGDVTGADNPAEGGSRPLVRSLTSNFAHSSAPNTGNFECSNEIFNRAHFIIDKATRSNMHAVLTDCPHREKLGWLEESHLNGPGLLFNYDMRTLYPKIMRDIADSQLPDGLIPDIAPEYVIFKEGFRDSPEWGTAGVMIPWMYYEWYGDDSLIRQYYDVMRRYTDYLASKAEGFVLSYGLGDWYDYGEKPAGVSQNTPLGITATGHFYLAADLTAKAAALRGDKLAQAQYRALADSIAEAFNTKLFDPATQNYGNGSQCSNAFPLFLDIVPAEHKQVVLENLLQDIENHGGRLSTGDVGNRYLYQALARNSQNEVMYKMHNHNSVPGYGFQIALGVTTLTEQWDPRRGHSWNHFMMGQIEEWFYRSLAGINPDPEKPGFAHFFIAPSPVGDLSYVKADYQSVKGKIAVDWRITGNVFHLSVTVPKGSTATLTMPYSGKKTLLKPGMHSFSEPVALSN